MFRTHEPRTNTYWKFSRAASFVFSVGQFSVALPLWSAVWTTVDRRSCANVLMSSVKKNTHVRAFTYISTLWIRFAWAHINTYSTLKLTDNFLCLDSRVPTHSHVRYQSQACNVLAVSCETPLGFELAPLRFSESAVQHSTHRATRVLRRRGRQSLTRRVPHYSPLFLSE